MPRVSFLNQRRGLNDCGFQSLVDENNLLWLSVLFVHEINNARNGIACDNVANFELLMHDGNIYEWGIIVDR
jgi:hypothetical protein